MRKLLILAGVLVPTMAAGQTIISFEPRNFNIAVASDGKVTGNRHLTIRVSRTPDAAADENCREISRVAVEADAEEIATAALPKPACRFLPADVPLRGEIISESEARELCADGDKTASVTKEVEVILTGESSSWVEESADVTISVVCGSTCAMPVIGAPDELPVATTGKSYHTTLSATGYGPVTFTHVDGDLPPGVHVAPNGLISGNPAAAGTYSFTIQAKDSCPDQPSTVRKKLTLRVEKPCPRLSLGREPTLPDATVGKRYSYPLQVSGGGKGLSVAVIAGRLPDGVTVSSDGVISGTPVAPGIRSFSIAASDTCGGEKRTAQRDYALTVFESPEKSHADRNEIVPPQRKNLDAVEKVRRIRDEASAAFMKFDSDMEIYRKAVLDYNVRLGSCNQARFTDKDRRAAGCLRDDSAARCSAKLLESCLGDLTMKLDDARRKVKDDAADVRGAAISIENIAGKLP